MFDLSKLFRILPISGLEPEIIGWIEGLTNKIQRRGLHADITLPEQPPAKAMIEFIPRHPWRCDMDNSEGLASLAEWHKIFRPIVERLEWILDKPLYQFRNFDVKCDDDYGHRFLVLYCCCHDQPESPYIQFLREASGVKDIDSLKSVLIDPENYRHPFEMNDTSCDDYVAHGCRFHY